MTTQREKLYTVIMKDHTIVEIYAETLTDAAEAAKAMFPGEWMSVGRTNINPKTTQEDNTKNPDGSYLYP